MTDNRFSFDPSSYIKTCAWKENEQGFLAFRVFGCAKGHFLITFRIVRDDGYTLAAYLTKEEK